MQRTVEIVIGKLVTDPALLRRFAADANSVLLEIREQGFELTAVEVDSLASIDISAISTFARSLDRRIQRLEHP